MALVHKVELQSSRVSSCFKVHAMRKVLVVLVCSVMYQKVTVPSSCVSRNYIFFRFGWPFLGLKVCENVRR